MGSEEGGQGLRGPYVEVIRRRVFRVEIMKKLLVKEVMLDRGNFSLPGQFSNRNIAMLDQTCPNSPV